MPKAKADKMSLRGVGHVMLVMRCWSCVAGHAMTSRVCTGVGAVSDGAAPKYCSWLLYWNFHQWVFQA